MTAEGVRADEFERVGMRRDIYVREPILRLMGWLILRQFRDTKTEDDL